MSRRESRVSMNVRQNDALLEFETFKKKFLLANKHITKLNSTLSVRIEELNAQISSLYVENLRLRASEIALAAQLKREREKSRKVMTEAEAATLNLTKHLSYLRQSYNITPSSPAPTSPPSPRARKRPLNRNPAYQSSNSPQVPRLSRAPNIPGIGEEEEPLISSSEHEADKLPSPVQRKSSKSKPRLSASRLPLPARVPEPPSLLVPADAVPPLELQQPRSSTRPRKPTRRQSGLLSLNDSLSVPRSPSPAFGSPIRMAAGLAAEEEEEAAAVDEQLTLEADMEVEVEVEIHPKKMRRKSKDREAEEKEKEKNKEREPEDVARVHNPPPREQGRERDNKRAKGEDDDNGKGKPRLKDVTNSRAVLLPIDNTAYDQPDEAGAATTRQFLGTSPSSSQPNSRSSSSPIPPSDGEGGGRERRARRSVNYAEPKLNTKMRKPDPLPETAPPPTKKRSSAAAVLTTYRPPLEDAGDIDTEGARLSLEGSLPLYLNGSAIDPALFPLPPSRPPSAVASSSAADSLLFSSPGSRSSVKRKKSRPQVTLDDGGEDSEGVHADVEHGYGYGPGWVNVEGRRKGGGGGLRRSASDVSDDTRRHSMAV